MDLILQQSVLLLAKHLELDGDSLLLMETADELLTAVLKQLHIVIPENPWAIQYADVNGMVFLEQVEQDYEHRQQQFNKLVGIADETGLLRFARHTLMIELLRLACLRRYESVEQAQAVKQVIRDQVETIMLNCSDAMYQRLRELKALLIIAIEQQEETLPHVRYVRYGVSLPALLVSYRLYETVARESDIVARNRIRHPGFCPVDHDIEVLSA